MGGNLEEQWKNLPLTEGEDEGIDKGIYGKGVDGLREIFFFGKVINKQNFQLRSF